MVKLFIDSWRQCWRMAMTPLPEIETWEQAAEVVMSRFLIVTCAGVTPLFCWLVFDWLSTRSG